MKPDLCLFGQDIPRNIVKDNGKYLSHFGFAELFIEIKARAGKDDPFLDTVAEENTGHNSFIKEDDSENTVAKNLGQIVAYAAELCARQHRTHCFSISVYGTTARLIRWDRSGAVVSSSFNYKDSPEWLCKFFWRYSQTTDTQRGFDMTVTRATLEEELQFKSVVKSHIEKQLGVTDSEADDHVLDHYEEHAVFKIPIHPQQTLAYKLQSNYTSNHSEGSDTCKSNDEACSGEMPWDETWKEDIRGNTTDGEVGDDTSFPLSGYVQTDAKTIEQDKGIYPECRKYSNVQYFLVSRPVAAPLSVASRGTRGYWSVKLPDESLNETEYRISFLKDTWRVEAEGMEIEGESMVKMIEAGVRFISDIICDGDVHGETVIVLLLLLVTKSIGHLQTNVH